MNWDPGYDSRITTSMAFDEGFVTYISEQVLSSVPSLFLSGLRSVL
jgi:hypothetical protein